MTVDYRARDGQYVGQLRLDILIVPMLTMGSGERRARDPDRSNFVVDARRLAACRVKWTGAQPRVVEVPLLKALARMVEPGEDGPVLSDPVAERVVSWLADLVSAEVANQVVDWLKDIFDVLLDMALTIPPSVTLRFSPEVAPVAGAAAFALTGEPPVYWSTVATAVRLRVRGLDGATLWEGAFALVDPVLGQLAARPALHGARRPSAHPGQDDGRWPVARDRRRGGQLRHALFSA